MATGPGDGDDDDNDRIELNDDVRWINDGVLDPAPSLENNPVPPPPLDDPGRGAEDPFKVVRPLELPGLVSFGIIQPLFLSFAASSLLMAKPKRGK